MPSLRFCWKGKRLCRLRMINAGKRLQLGWRAFSAKSHFGVNQNLSLLTNSSLNIRQMPVQFKSSVKRSSVFDFPLCLCLSIFHRVVHVPILCAAARVPILRPFLFLTRPWVPMPRGLKRSHSIDEHFITLQTLHYLQLLSSSALPRLRQGAGIFSLEKKARRADC